VNTFRFEDPWALLLCAALLPLIFFGFRGRRNATLKYSMTELAGRLEGEARAGLQHLPPLLRIFVLLLIVGGLARPQWGNKSSEVLSEGVDIILALDTSGTMEALDFVAKGKRVSRLEAVKSVVKEFVTGRKSDRLGMVVFGTNAFLQCPRRSTTACCSISSIGRKSG